jgi:hypothetical protein
VSEILHSSIPDAAGDVIPAGITEGSAEIAGALGEQQHILVSMDAGVYNVRKAICGTVCWTCDGVSYAFVYLDPFGVAVGGTSGETFYEQWSTGSQTNPSASWSSSSTGVATVNNSGVVTGLHAGAFTVYAVDLLSETAAIDPYCSTDLYCPTENFSGSGSGDTVKATIDSFVPEPIPTGSTASVHITVNPSATVTLTITSTGTGSATFGTSGKTQITISETTTVNILGNTASQPGAGDLTLAVSYGDETLASQAFSVGTTGARTATYRR